MRRKNQALTKEENIAVLNRGTCGVLSVSGDDGYPYGVPLNYVYHDGSIYFHCAKSGHKLDAIARNDKASFCVIDADQVLPEEYTSLFRSVIAFGRVQVIDKDADKRRALEILSIRFAPEEEKALPSPSEDLVKKIDDDINNLLMLELKIEHLSGKESKRWRQQQKG